MGIDIDGADAYFAVGNHIHALIWQGFTDAAIKAAAITQATRELTVVLRSPPVAPTNPTLSTFPREDFAVYEQALMLLRNRVDRTNAEGTAPLFQPEDREAGGSRISPEASFWLGSAQIILTRG